MSTTGLAKLRPYISFLPQLSEASLRSECYDLCVSLFLCLAVCVVTSNCHIVNEVNDMDEVDQVKEAKVAAKTNNSWLSCAMPHFNL